MNDFRKLANNEGYLIDLQGVKIYYPQETINHITNSGHMDPQDASGSVFKKGLNIENIFQEMIDNSSKKEMKGNMIQFETNSHIGYDAYVDKLSDPDGFIVKTEKNKKVISLAKKNDRFAVEGSFHSNATNYLSGIVLDSSNVRFEKNQIPLDFECRELYEKGILNYGVSLFPGKSFKNNGDPIPKVSSMKDEGFFTQENKNYIPVNLNTLDQYHNIRDNLNNNFLTSEHNIEEIKLKIQEEVQQIKQKQEINILREKASTYNPLIHVTKINHEGEKIIGFKSNKGDFSDKLEKALRNNEEKSLKKQHIQTKEFHKKI